MAQGHDVANALVPPSGNSNHGISALSTSRLSTASLEDAITLLEIPNCVNLLAVCGRLGSQEQTLQPQSSGFILPECVSSHTTQHGSDTQPVVNMVQFELATSIAVSAAAAAAVELPCIVKLRVWPHDVKDPYAQMKFERCLFIIPHVILCRQEIFFPSYPCYNSVTLDCL